MRQFSQLTKSAFDFWLRTGRVAVAPIEYKFNGWHDPEDGKFTHVGGGRYFPPGSAPAGPKDRAAVARAPRAQPDGSWGGGGFTGRGGGGFGGAGSTGGYWETLEERQARERQMGRRRGSLPAATSQAVLLRPVKESSQFRYLVQKGDTLSSIARQAKMTVDQLVAVNSISDRNKIDAGQELLIPSKVRSKPDWVAVQVDQLTFELDKPGRTRDLHGTLGSTSSGRVKKLQARAGRPDRQAADDGGHFIAPRFGGPKAAYNHFAQNANFNRGSYRALEESWAKAQKVGENVHVRISVRYPIGSRRPRELTVEAIIAGKRKSQDFGNKRGGGID